jgi:hypothetical protein
MRSTIKTMPMNKMHKKKNDIARWYWILFLAVFFFPASTEAALSATFNPSPLFKETNFLPGSVSSGNITIFNTFTETQSAYVEAINVSDPGKLGSKMRLKIFEGVSVLYDDSFKNFLTKGKVSLSNIPSNSSKTYKFEVQFLDDSGNDYQKKSLGFDICVGFMGGNFQCGDTVIGPSSNPGSGSTSIPGSSGSSIVLQIFNESYLITNPGTQLGVADGEVLVTWNTNRLATGRVIYGPIAGGPYFLDINNPPYYGYPFGTEEIEIKKTGHNFLISGLLAGETYVYRVVSRASPATISPEYSFTLVTNQGIILGTMTSEEIKGEPGFSLEDGSEENQGIVLAEEISIDTKNKSLWFYLFLLVIIFGLGFFVFKKYSSSEQ